MSFFRKTCSSRFCWLVVFLLPIGQAEVASAKKIDGDQLLDPQRMVEIRIELPKEDWARLCEQSRDVRAAFSGLPSPNPYSYFKADLWIDGVKIESVGIRKKGFLGSADNQRPSLKVKFDEYVEQDPIDGLSRLTLNNNKQDRSQASQFLTYELFRRAGNPAPRSNWAHVTVNGESLGVYSHVESIKKPFLSRSFGDNTGNLYEGTLTDFHPKAVVSIEVKTNEDENDLSDINKLASLLYADGELDVEQLGQVINLDSFYRHWALEGLTGFWDGYSANQNNFYLYFDPKDGGRGTFIPWGTDWLFTGRSPFAQFGRGNPGTTVIYAQSVLANRVYRSSEGPERYRATMKSLLDNAWDEEKMLAEIDRIEKLVTPHLHSSQGETREGLDEIREFIRGRRDVVERALDDWSPEIPEEPRTPSHVVDVGKASGFFSTVLQPQAERGQPDQELSATRASEFTLELDKSVVELSKVTVAARLFRTPSFGGFGGRGGRPRAEPGPPSQVSIAFVGERSGEEPITLTLIVDRQRLKDPNGDAFEVTGSLQEGRGGGFRFGGPRRSVIGTIWLNKSGTEQGEEVVGGVDLRIVESRGGFFSQRRGPSGPRQTRPGNSPGRPGQPPSPSQAPPVSVQSVLDTDRDGTVSASEIENAAAALKRLDRNRDGKLSGDELQSRSTGDVRREPTRRRRPELEDEADAPAETTPDQKVASRTKADPVVMTTEQDHRNMMEQLGITRLRPGPSGSPDAPNSANYDESKANPYPKLPDVLTRKDGTKVTSADQWWNQRRPEIVSDFEREVLGEVPDNVPEVTWELLKTVEKTLGETAVIEKRLAGRVDNSACPEISVNIMLSVVTPKDAENPVPALMMFGFTMFGPDGEDLNFGGRFGGGRRQGGPPPTTQQLVEAGWGYVTINANSIQEDSGGERQRRFGPPRTEGQTGGGLTRGVIGLTNHGQPRKPNQWGSLRAWAWGASRALDHLETDSNIDSKRVGIEGVSRYGKAALVTLAFDQRFAMGLIGSSGEGGASLYRRHFGEAVESLTSSGEYHWMAGNFLKYGTAVSSFGSKNASDLPVDSHQLIALCAPRPTFISYGVPEKGDALWLDQQGSFMAAIAAQPAFRLLGASDLGRSDDYMHEKMPPVNEGLLGGDLAWRQHDGGHTDGPNVPHFIRWAQSRWESKSTRP